MAPHSSTVARKIPWMEEPGRLQSMGSLRVRHDWVTSLSLSSRGSLVLLQHIKKQRHHFTDKGPYSQSYSFSSSHVKTWELDHKEGWAPNWCFWTVVLEKTLESPLDYKEIQAVHPKRNQSWIVIGSTDAEAETLILWLPDGKSWLIGKDPDAGKIEGGRRRGRQRMRWLNGIMD